MRISLIAAGALVFAWLYADAAEARTVWLKGRAADRFIALHLPHAVIPGPINAPFFYGAHRRGWASCNIPAMGARGDGVVSTCDVRY